MNRDEKEFLEKFSDGILNEDTELPEGLKKEKIVKYVKGRKQEDKKKSYKKWVALAASFVFVIAAVVTGAKLMYKPVVVVPIANNTDSEVYNAGSYAEIENFFLSVREKTKAEKNSSWFGEKGEVYIAASANGSSVSGSASMDTAETGSATQASTGEFSRTDLQVEGVDEADIIKNDGKYLFVLNSDYRNCVSIIDTVNPSDLKVSSAIEIEKKSDETISIDEFYLKDNKLVVIYHEYTSVSTRNENSDYFYSTCCYCGTADQKYSVVIYDVTDRANPKKESTYSIDGSGVSSRLVGSKLLLVSNYRVALFDDDEKLKEACIPSFYKNGERTKLFTDSIDIINGNDENTYSVIMSVDIDEQPDEPDCLAILGGSSEIYCNGDNLYISRLSYENDSTAEIYDYSKEFTKIYKLGISGKLEYKCTGKAQGNILNQFSMDESNGYFRIATTTFGSGSLITIFDENMVETGKTEKVADGENIYAVRFMGDTAYVVTFLQTDPLFVIDLSDPKAPVVTGELKIPGFSNMLFPYSDKYLIGIGQDGTESGSTNKLKISLFDISDKNNPQEISKAVINGYSSSQAQYDHKAYFKIGSNGEFGIPVCVYGDNYSGNQQSFVLVMTVNGDKLETVNKYIVAEGNEIYRGAYTGNTIFAMTHNKVTAFDKSSGEVLGNVLISGEDKANESLVVID